MFMPVRILQLSTPFDCGRLCLPPRCLLLCARELFMQYTCAIDAFVLFTGMVLRGAAAPVIELPSSG